MTRADELRALLDQVDPARFWAKVERQSPDICWSWKGYRQNGYGIWRFSKNESVRAHRAAYFFSRGGLPAAMCVCHACDNRPCCNPRHLWVGTFSDNNRDRALKGRNGVVFRDPEDVNWAVGERHGSAKLMISDVLAIKSSPLSLSTLAEIYGINKTTASRIKRGSLWASALIAQAEEERS